MGTLRGALTFREPVVEHDLSIVVADDVIAVLTGSYLPGAKNLVIACLDDLIFQSHRQVKPL
jgi:hypothetical protein